MSFAAAPAASLDAPSKADESSSLRIDSLSTGILLMMSLALAQRLVGLVRGLFFCRLLTPQELGYWDLTFSFLMLAAPLAVLGLPGSFGRYVEHYRQRGQLRIFLARTALVSAALAIIGVVCVLVGRHQISYLLFGDFNHEQLVIVLGFSLLAVISFNFVISLFTALRLTRVVSSVQFAHSVLFAGTGLGLICFWKPAALSIVIAYGIACLVTVSGTVIALGRVWQATSVSTEPIPQRSFWAKLMPFAFWVWATNLLTNLFMMSDRYMIMHFGSHDATIAAEMVGNYHSSRVVPLLLITVAGMLGGLVLPHLSHDWEAGRRTELCNRLNLLFKVLGLSLAACGCLILIASPTLFGWLLAGKYAGGLRILPWTLIYCIWFGLCLAAQNYLWCAEKAKYVSLAYCCGLIGNIGLNAILLPWLGLLGAALATGISMATALALILLFGRSHGMLWDRGVFLVALLPLSLCLGPLVAIAVLTALIGSAFGSQWLFGAEEKNVIRAATTKCLSKLGWSAL